MFVTLGWGLGVLTLKLVKSCFRLWAKYRILSSSGISIVSHLILNIAGSTWEPHKQSDFGKPLLDQTVDDIDGDGDVYLFDNVHQLA